ncbi:hypothetical protein Slin15195_G022510 [Septoria linicola]|uniref:Uncharacterized protein n=1 Tax=Septoria linicola TaxID=215465 RepID=A0A9Q9EGK9_9PEZI|nr:hypothetical protein Slin14017_G021540 [Septoria linicola]USW48932.1 hypothetical protein Slin15195_G022510 [Septoria linicola]
MRIVLATVWPPRVELVVALPEGDTIGALEATELVLTTEDDALEGDTTGALEVAELVLKTEDDALEDGLGETVEEEILDDAREELVEIGTEEEEDEDWTEELTAELEGVTVTRTVLVLLGLDELLDVS